MEKINNSQNIAKGILICSVIFFHSKIFLDYSALNTFSILFLLFPCIIGVFFFYSGYNYKPKKKNTERKYKKKNETIIITISCYVGIINNTSCANDSFNEK